MNRTRATGELLRFLADNKRWWLFPIVAVLVAMAALITFASGSALAPFIYTIF